MLFQSINKGVVNGDDVTRSCFGVVLTHIILMRPLMCKHRTLPLLTAEWPSVFFISDSSMRVGIYQRNKWKDVL